MASCGAKDNLEEQKDSDPEETIKKLNARIAELEEEVAALRKENAELKGEKTAEVQKSAASKDEPQKVEQGDGNPIATFTVTCGKQLKELCRKRQLPVKNNCLSFKAEIYLKEQPITASNFISLANKKYYDGVHFHRVIKNFMCQFGCPNTRNKPNSRTAGQGSPKPGSKFPILSGKRSGETYTRNKIGCIEDEYTDARFSNEPLTLSMANAGPNSGGSQFFINMNHNMGLDWFAEQQPESKHPVFGKVIVDDTNSWKAAEAIQNVRVDKGAGDRPREPVKMKSIRVRGPGVPQRPKSPRGR